VAREPGFPRFKSYDRFSGFGLKHHGDGFRFTPGPNWRNGKLRLSAIGTMDARGDARTPGKVVSCDIMRKVDGRFLSLVIECEPHRECGSLDRCGCGFVATRDQAAALSMLADGLSLLGREPAWAAGPKLPPEPLSGLEGGSSY